MLIVYITLIFDNHCVYMQFKILIRYISNFIKYIKKKQSEIKRDAECLIFFSP